MDTTWIKRKRTHAQRSASPVFVENVCISGTLAELILKSISVVPALHLFHWGVAFEGSNFVFGLREITTSKNDWEKDVMNSVLS